MNSIRPRREQTPSLRSSRRAYKDLADQLVLIFQLELSQYKFKPGRKIFFDWGMGSLSLEIEGGVAEMEEGMWFSSDEYRNLNRMGKLGESLKQILIQVKDYNNREDQDILGFLHGRNLIATKETL
jgi:hypothetical protein